MEFDTANSEARANARQLLRSVPVLQHSGPPFDSTNAPADPAELFLSWMQTAIAADVIEPHAMVLSTVDEGGVPDARLLILKDVRDGAWWFATDTSTAKAGQLSLNPVAALTFYWPTIGRQVRLRGAVRSGTTAENEHDYLARGAAARAVVVAAQETSETTREQFAQSVSEAEARLAASPSLGSEAWRTYGVDPIGVEFWQADPDRMHRRLIYSRTNDGWRHRTPAH